MSRLTKAQLALFSLTLVLQLAQVFMYKLFYLAAAATFLISLLILLVRPLQARQAVLSSVPLAILFSYFALTSLWSIDPYNTLHFLAIDLIWLPVFTISYTALLNNRLRACIQVLAPLPLAILCFFAYAYWRYGTLRPEFGSGVSALCNLSSVLLCGYFPFFLWMSQQRRGSALFKGLAVLVGILLAISQSRAGIIVGAVTLLATLFTLSRRPLVFARSMVTWGLILATVFAAFRVSPTLSKAVDYTLDRITLGNYDIFDLADRRGAYADSDRRLQYAEGLRVAAAKPWFGIGYMSFAQYMSDLHGKRTTLHSVYLAVAAEGGLFCLMIFAGVVVHFFRSCARAWSVRDDPELRDFAKVCALGMFSMLLFGLFGQIHQVFVFYNLYAWGVALGAVRARRQRLAAAVWRSVVFQTGGPVKAVPQECSN